MLEPLEYRNSAWNKLINTIKGKFEEGKSVILDKAYLKDEKYSLKNIKKENENFIQLLFSILSN